MEEVLVGDGTSCQEKSRSAKENQVLRRAVCGCSAPFEGEHGPWVTPGEEEGRGGGAVRGRACHRSPGRCQAALNKDEQSAGRAPRPRMTQGSEGAVRDHPEERSRRGRYKQVCNGSAWIRNRKALAQRGEVRSPLHADGGQEIT